MQLGFSREKELYLQRRTRTKKQVQYPDWALKDKLAFST